MAPTPNKLRVYAALYNFNRSLQEVMGDLKTLESTQLFPRRFLRACRHAAEELRARANRKFTEVLNVEETKEEARLSRATADRT